MGSKILFVNQPISLEERYGPQSGLGNNTAPLTLCHLAAITRKHGYQTAILDAATQRMSMENALAKILQEKPRYLAFYGTTLTIENAAVLASAVKRESKQIVVIVGGIHFTYCPEETMERYSSFDVGVVGEGDSAVVELLEALEAGKDLNGVRGIIFRSGRQLVRTAGREPVEDLNGLPMPAFDLLEGFPEIYIPPFFGFSTLPVATAVMSRGCPSRCIFCSSGIFGNKNLRVYSPKYIVELMRLLKERCGVEQLLFYDDNFGTFRAHVKELCERIIKAGLEMTWSCNTRVTDVSPDLLALMKKAGCWQISYGIESGSQRLLDFMRKGTTLETIRRALRWTWEAGIRTNGYFIFGFPTETEQEIVQTVKFAKSLDLDIFQCTLFTPFPNTAVSGEIQKYGRLESSNWSDMSIFNPVFVTEGLSSEKLETFKRKAMRSFYFRPRVQWGILRMVLENPVMLSHYVRTFREFLRFTVLQKGKRSHGLGTSLA